MKIYKQNDGENSRMYAHRVILDNIVKLEFPPGSAISEKEIAAALNVSRTPVREALIEMSKLSLVEIRPQKGSYVKKINADMIEDIQFLRLSLELSVVRMACEQGLSDESRDLLQKNIEEQKACIDLIDAQETMMELDDEFHRLLFQAVGKSTVYEMIRGQTYNFDRLRMLIFKTLKTAKNSQTVHDHLNILYAIEQHDWKLAHTVMTTHLSRHIEVKEELEKCYPDYF